MKKILKCLSISALLINMFKISNLKNNNPQYNFIEGKETFDKLNKRY